MRTQYERLVPLSQVGLADSIYVGNKAAVLGELMRHGLNVPDGFCITTNSFKALIDSLSLSFSFDHSKTSSLNDSSNLADKILQSTFPQDLAKEVQSALTQVKRIKNAPLMFCVRSSASVEDRPDFSFAGQFHTSIGLNTLDDIILAIKKCWASLFQEPVITYIANSGFDISDASVDVLIQALVPAEKSGVLFTCDPITGEHVLMIEATWGLGSPLVSGQITPDYIRLAPSGKVLNYTIGSKKSALIIVNSNLKEITVEPSLRAAHSLKEQELTLLQKEAERIDQILGSCQDVEFAFFDNNLWTLQSRPITGLKRLASSKLDDEYE